jgi:hypothetical protein
MAATTGHSINTGPYRENTEISSSLKLLHWLNEKKRFETFFPKGSMLNKSCHSRHFEFHIRTKNVNFVEDHPMNIHVQFVFCPFSLGHCIVCPPCYDFYTPLWYM